MYVNKYAYIEAYVSLRVVYFLWDSPTGGYALDTDSTLVMVDEDSQIPGPEHPEPALRKEEELPLARVLFPEDTIDLDTPPPKVLEDRPVARPLGRVGALKEKLAASAAAMRAEKAEKLAMLKDQDDGPLLTRRQQLQLQPKGKAKCKAKKAEEEDLDGQEIDSDEDINARKPAAAKPKAGAKGKAKAKAKGKAKGRAKGKASAKDLPDLPDAMEATACELLESTGPDAPKSVSVHPKAKESAQPKSNESVQPKSQESVQLKSNESVHPKSESVHPKSHESVHPKSHEPDMPKSQESVHPKSREPDMPKSRKRKAAAPTSEDRPACVDGRSTSRRQMTSALQAELALPRQGMAIESMTAEQIMDVLHGCDLAMRIVVDQLSAMDGTSIPTKACQAGLPRYDCWQLSTYWTRNAVGMLHKCGPPHKYAATFASGGSDGMAVALESASHFVFRSALCGLLFI